MDIGSGILGGSVVIGAVATVFKLFGSNGNGSNGHCKDHSGICTSIEDFQAWLTKIEAKLDRAIERRSEPRI